MFSELKLGRVEKAKRQIIGVIRKYLCTSKKSVSLKFLTVMPLSIIQGILCQTNGMMPISLQDKCTFSLLGYCRADFSSNGIEAANERDGHTNTTNHHTFFCGTENSCVGKNVGLDCECCKVDGFLEHFGLASSQSESWVQLACISSTSTDRKLQMIPQFNHIHWNGEIVSKLDLHVCKSRLLLLRICSFYFISVLHRSIFPCFLIHIFQVIIYEIPKFGHHHYSLGSQSSTGQMRNPTKKPKWVEDLQQNSPFLDLVILLINLFYWLITHAFIIINIF